MDSIDLLEAAQGDEILELPTIEEAEALLRDDGEDTSNPDPDSPTAAVKSAIEARIAENLVSLDSTLISNIDSNIVSNKDTAVLPTPPQQILPKKPQPLFPEGLPLSGPPNLAKIPNPEIFLNLTLLTLQRLKPNPLQRLGFWLSIFCLYILPGPTRLQSMLVTGELLTPISLGWRSSKTPLNP